MSGIKDALLADTPFSDYVPVFQRHSEPSRQAALSIASVSGRDRKRVLTFIQNHPYGVTDEQIADALQLAGNTARPRRRELEQANLIKDSGCYALTRSGRKATLWVAA